MGCGHEDFPCCGCGHDEIGHDMSEFEDDAPAFADDFEDFEDEPQPDDSFDDEPGDGFRDDVDADADTLRSAGYGTDEDYGYYGDRDE